MPTYEFRCPRGHEFEKFYRTISSAESAAACPICGEIGERMMSATGFAFKGSGFYLTDYGKNAHREKGTPTPAGAPPGEGGKSESASTDGAKPESKGEPVKASSAEASASTSNASEGKSSEGKASERKTSEGKASEPKAAPAPPKKSPGE
jgi:putative FmdB family regulatory protein